MQSRTFRLLATAFAGLALAAGAQAQNSMNSTYPANNNWMPWGQGGYVGLNLGRSDYSLGCGALPTACDDSGSFGRLTLGSMVGPHLGYEIAYLDMGSVDRAGGDTRAHGINLSVVGRVPVASQFGLFGKIGTTYGRTRVSSVAGSGVPAGSDSGFGLSYGVGASFDFNPQWSVVLEWERHDFHFAGSGREDVDATSLGLRYRF